jgi:hypothetical protein
MSALDLSHLSPDDAVAALRSYPRRFRELITSVPLDDLPDAVLEHADHVARSVALLGEALRQVLVQDRPVLHPGIASDTEREWSMPSTTSAETVLDFLQVECDAMADTIRDVTADAWNRTGLVAGADREVSALDLVREAVRTGSDHLRSAQSLLASDDG